MTQKEFTSEFTIVEGGIQALVVAVGVETDVYLELLGVLSKGTRVNNFSVSMDEILLNLEGCNIVIKSDTDAKRAIAQRMRHAGILVMPYKKGNSRGIMLTPRN